MEEKVDSEGNSVPPTMKKTEGFTVADAILVLGQTRVKIYSECIGKIVILMLDNLRKV